MIECYLFCVGAGNQLQGLFNTSNDAQLNQSMGFNGSFGFTQQPSSQISQVDGNIFGSSSAFGASSQQQINMNNSAAFGGAFSQLGSFAATSDQSSFGQPQAAATNSFPQRPLVGASSSELLGSLQPVVAQPSAFQHVSGAGAMPGFPGSGAGQVAGFPASNAGTLPGYGSSGQAVSQAGQQQSKAYSFANMTGSSTKVK